MKNEGRVSSVTLFSEDGNERMTFVVRSRGVEIVRTGAPQQHVCEACRGTGSIWVTGPPSERILAKNRTLEELIEASLQIGWRRSNG